MSSRRILILGIVVLATLSTIVIVANANVQPANVRVTWLYTLSVVQLVVGLLAYRRLAGAAAASDLSPRSLLEPSHRRLTAIGALTLVLTLAVAIGLTRHEQFFPQGSGAAGQLFYFLIMIALPEELIYRGIAFQAFAKRSVAAVLVSAALFSLMHINNGIGFLAYYFAFGILLGTLRRFDMSLAGLVLWHGLFDFVNDTVWPAVGFRTSPIAFFVVAPLALLAITALAGWIATEGGKARSNQDAANSRSPAPDNA